MKLIEIHPKLPSRDIRITETYYTKSLGFERVGTAVYPDYLMLRKEGAELHFFQFKDLNPRTNYGQVYIRTDGIDALYELFLKRGVPIHPNAPLERKPWGQKEFSVLDPDHNLLTFGQASED